MKREEAAAIARAVRAARAPSLSDRFWSKVDILGPDDCWPWIAARRNKKHGYGAFWFEKKHRPSGWMAWHLTSGPVPPGLFICHNCDNPSCCNPKHLFLGTNQENNDDKVAKGRHVFGQRVWTCKLTPDQVEYIRAQKPEGIKRAPDGLPGQLAEKFGVTKQYISEIWGNRGWRKL